MAISFRPHRELLTTYLRPQWAAVGGMAALLLTGIALQLVAPQILARFIDAARAGADTADLLRLAGIFLAVAFVSQVVSGLSVYASETVGWNATNGLRADLALHCLRLDLPFHNARTPGEMIERVDGDVSQLSSFFSQLVIRVLGNAVLLVGILALLFRADWRVGAAYTALTLVALLALRRTLGVAVPHWRQARQATAVLIGFLEERLSGTEDIRSSGAVPYVMRRLYQTLRDQLARSRKAWLMGNLIWVITVALLALGHAMAFGFGAYLLRAGAVTMGTVYLFFHYTQMLARPLETITRQVQDLQRASASVGRVRDLLMLQPRAPYQTRQVPMGESAASTSRVGTGRGGDGHAHLPAGALGVECRGVSFGYVEDDLVLNDVSFTLAPGAVLGLLGRTGSGKTTIGRLLVRLYDPTAGGIRLGGIDTRDVPRAELRRRVGMVTQDVQLFYATVRDNLTFFDPRVTDEQIMAVLYELGLEAWLRALPRGLDTPLAPRGLSAGEAQLLAFARVFFKDPGLVILDEASSRLDPVTERLIERAVDALLRNRTAIIIAHRLATVQRADEIMMVDAGQIVEHGPRADLVADPDSRFAALLRTGLEEVLA